MSAMHADLMDHPCAVRTPAGWFRIEHTPLARTVKVEDLHTRTATCATCDEPLVRFFIQPTEDRLGHWTTWVTAIYALSGVSS